VSSLLFLSSGKADFRWLPWWYFVPAVAFSLIWVLVPPLLLCSDCPDKTRLLVAYSDAGEAFSVAVSQLRERAPVVLQEEYERLRLRMEQSRLGTDKARWELERHVAEHGC
jgi:hypothetical protein